MKTYNTLMFVKIERPIVRIWKIFSTVLCLQLILVDGSLLMKTCHNDSCTHGILDAAVELIKKGRSLNKNSGDQNGANCLLDAAVKLINKAKGTTPKNRKDEDKAVDCEELLLAGFKESGNYTIWPKSGVNERKSIDVYCDMQTDGGGWTVIQRKGNFGRPKDFFNQDFLSYKSGFGDIKQDFWLGNENILRITNLKKYSVRFDLKAFDGENRYALYDTFWIEDESRNYTLHFNNHISNAGDSMNLHRNMKSSTSTKYEVSTEITSFQHADNDNSTNRDCANLVKGLVTKCYNACQQVVLKGMYLEGQHKSSEDDVGMSWYDWRDHFESLETTEIKIRSKSFKKN